MTGNNRRGMVLQERDRHLLRELSVMRIADREQVKYVGGFHSTTRVNARLLALTRAKLLRRFFIGTTHGTRKALYSLSPSGAELVQVPYRGLRRGSDEMLVADFFVAHQLRINDLYCLLKYRPIPVPGVRCTRWISFHEPIAVAFHLIPDGYTEFETPTETIAAFLEIDLGHESRAVWRKKVEEYLQHALSGNFPKQFQQNRFRTLVVAHSERRLESLRTATAAVTQKIFWFTTFEAINRDGFWSAIWRRPDNAQRQSLL